MRLHWLRGSGQLPTFYHVIPFAIVMDARMLMLWSTITQSAVRTVQARKVIKKRLQRSRERLHRARRRLLQWRINMTAMVFLALALEPVNRNVYSRRHAIIIIVSPVDNVQTAF